MLALVFLYETSKLPDGHKEQSREMLNRMILAMNISQDSYKVFEFAKGDIETAGYKEGLIGDIASARPKFVVTFGAMATNLLLNKRERLGRIHGLFFNQALPAHHTTKVIPVFHPDFLCINPKMKRAAWNDLQKVMKVLNRS